MAPAPRGIRLEIAKSIDDFRWDRAGYEAMIRIPVVADLIKRAIRVEAAAKRNATQRPGPNVQTGRLRASITWRPGIDAAGPYIDVGTSVIYARRIELGFTGMDSLGRQYDQPPYPFLVPALDAARVPL